MSDADEFQAWTAEMSVYPGVGSGDQAAVAYATLGLTGEAGEVAEKVKKWLRGDRGKAVTVGVVANDIKLELGDVMFYVARLATECGFTLSDVMAANREKLLSRKQRGVIKGSGDNR